MGEIIDLESYRRQRRRRPVETRTVETGTGANRRHRNRGRAERDRLRPAVDPPAVEFLDHGRGDVGPVADTEPGDKSAD